MRHDALHDMDDASVAIASSRQLISSHLTHSVSARFLNTLPANSGSRRSSARKASREIMRMAHPSPPATNRSVSAELSMKATSPTSSLSSRMVSCTVSTTASLGSLFAPSSIVTFRCGETRSESGIDGPGPVPAAPSSSSPPSSSSFSTPMNWFLSFIFSAMMSEWALPSDLPNRCPLVLVIVRRFTLTSICIETEPSSIR
mmetsp:Transcript_9439/g.30285  ORF Transcript_9439/g.30285 Transcript_9439/m.30285 type:complete len:201 (+) Transcript_9439:3003-3605(+)